MRKSDVVQEFVQYGSAFLAYLDQKDIEARSSMAKLRRDEDKAIKKAEKGAKKAGKKAAKSDPDSADIVIADLPPVTGEMDEETPEDDRDYGNSDDPDAPPEIMSADTVETDGVFDDEPADDGVNERPQDGIEESPDIDKIINGSNYR